MKKVLLALALLLVVPSLSRSQAPVIQVHFESGIVTGDKFSIAECQGNGVIETVSFVTFNIVGSITAIEFSVEFPPPVQWISDLPLTPVTIGSAPTGISIAWSIPQAAFPSLVVHQSLVQWNCDDCGQIGLNQHLVKVNPHPATGELRAVKWPDFTFVNIFGHDAFVCFTIPVEESSWGRIKELYE